MLSWIPVTNLPVPEQQYIFYFILTNCLIQITSYSRSEKLTEKGHECYPSSGVYCKSCILGKPEELIKETLLEKFAAGLILI